MTTETTDANRWAALYVLCLGHADDRARRDDRERRAALDPGRSWFLPGQPRLGRQRLPDRLRRAAAAGRPDRRPDRPAPHLPDRARRVHRRLAAVRGLADPGHADRRALRAGRRRRPDVGGHPRDDRDDVPRAEGAGQGDRRLHVRRGGRRLDRPAGRRRADPGDQLALDLLREPADRRRDRTGRAAPGRGSRGDRSRPGCGPSRRRAADRRPDAGRLHDPPGRAARLGLVRDARARLGRDRAADAASWRARLAPRIR